MGAFVVAAKYENWNWIFLFFAASLSLSCSVGRIEWTGWRVEKNVMAKRRPFKTEWAWPKSSFASPITCFSGIPTATLYSALFASVFFFEAGQLKCHKSENCSSRFTYIVQFVIKSACVAHRLAVVVSSPQSGLRGLTVGANGAFALRGGLKEKTPFDVREHGNGRVTAIISTSTHHSSFGFDEWPVLPVHLVIESAGVAQVVAVAVSPPQRSRSRPTIDALATLWKKSGINNFHHHHDCV